MDVDEKGTLFEGYELKLNSYDLGVDIELADAIERLRFEHPQVKVILLRSGKPRVFCAGANIRMLAGATHAHKVNFCKFTNETRNGIEDASEGSGLATICVINGTAAGGGYELALAADHIMLVDDGSSAVSLPELPLLAVLPGTGGLTRVTDKRKVRRDHADVFCTTEEGIKGKRAVDWRLVDEVVPGSKLEETVAKRAQEFAAQLEPAAPPPRASRSRRSSASAPRTGSTTARCRSSSSAPSGSRPSRCAGRTLRRRRRPTPWSRRARQFWPLKLARELDDAILDIRANEFDIAAIVFKSSGDPAQVLAYDAVPRRQQGSLARARDQGPVEARAQARRSHLALAGGAGRARLLLCRHARRARVRHRPLLHADRQARRRQQAAGDARARARSISAPIRCRTGSRGWRAAFSPIPPISTRPRPRSARCSMREAAEELGLVTFALDDIDWEDEIRVFLEERASFSPDGLTGLEANLRFGGPETMESKIFARLTAWQNWIFQRPNAVGEEGALKRYGTGQKPAFDTRRV